MRPEVQDRTIVPPAPQGRELLAWIGPAIIWMISAIATGEFLFTPRIASLYGYTVLWTLILAIFLKALLAREIGRYAVVTGGSLLQGIGNLSGPGNWGVWLIVLPQILVAVTTVTGMAGAASSAVILALPGVLPHGLSCSCSSHLPGSSSAGIGVWSGPPL